MDAVTETNIRVLYEDNHLLVVEKPVNMPVQADASGDPDLLTALKAYIKEKYQKPGDVYLGLVHRLDRPVGGVMAFARTSKAAARLSEQFQNNTAKKRYAAVVDGMAPAEGALCDWLLKDEVTHSSRVVPEGTAGAKLAKLSYALLGRCEADGRSLLDVSLYTGRPHQIRVQLAHAGLAIAGDQRYNAAAQKRAPAPIALFAYALTITHPTLGEQMTFTLPPRGEAFTAFPAATALLPAFRACRGLYVDGEVIAVDKNANVETEGELLGELRSLFGEVYPVHRLDANTEGVTLFARTQAAEARLTEAFYTHDVKKFYRCIVCGRPPVDAGRLVNYLCKDADSATVRVCRATAPGAMRSELLFSVRESAGGGESLRSLLDIELLTGRTHQIRVQTAAAGFPVLGDDKYGDRAANKALHARTQRLLCRRIEWEGRVFESLRELTL